MAPNRSLLIKTAQAFLATYSEWTPEALLSIRSPFCIHHVLPASDMFPARTNAEYGAMIQSILPVFNNFQLAVVDEEETVVDVEKRKVVLHVKSRADSVVGFYQNEYVFTLTMNEDGRLVDDVVEFLDSGYSAEFFGRLQGEK